MNSNIFNEFVDDINNYDNIESPEFIELQTLVYNKDVPSDDDSAQNSSNKFDLSEEEQNNLKNLLDGWGMGFLFQTCLAECVDIKALRYINIDQIAQLLKNYPLGIRIKFGYFINEWKKSKCLKNSIEPKLSTPSFNSTLISSTSLPQEPTMFFSLDDVLTNSTQGTLLTNYYKNNKNLNESCRNILVDLIIASLLKQNRPMSVALANQIADIIVGTFTTEIKETYFLRGGTKKYPKEKLYTKYFNKLRSLKNNGLVTPELTKTYKKNEKETLSRVCGNLDVEITIEEDAEMLVTSLKHNELTWPEIEMIWEKTIDYRLKNFRETNFSPLEIQKNWPHYMQPLGYKLVCIDFKHLYKNALDMLSTYDKSVIKLIQILDDRVKDHSCRTMLEDMKRDINASENSKNSIVLYLLHAVFSPTIKKTYINSDGNKCIIKFSIKDSQNSYVIVANIALELEEKLKARKNSNNPIQPCLLIVGTIMNPCEIMVYFDELKYKFFSIVKALEVCFKIYHVFNLEYPLESINVWLFIQRYFYNIKLQCDKPYPIINQIISELK